VSSAESTFCEVAVQLRSRSPSKVIDWPHVGTCSDVLKVRPEGFVRIIRCPRCKRTKHPQVAITATILRSRHCNFCHIRWTDDTPGGIRACYGDYSTQYLIDSLMGR